MKNSIRTLALAILVFCAGAGLHAQFPKFLYGIISVTSDDFSGKATASGETYDPDKLTVAHQTLPFGSEIEIENLENGKKVRAKVNERGPLAGNRLMDVSRKTAETLGFLRKGTVYAKVGILRMGDNKVKEPPAASNSGPQAVSSSIPATPAVQPAAKTDGPAVTAPASQPQPVIPVVRTNYETFYATNDVDITNYLEISITNTNILEIPPYEDKFIELPVEERETGKPLSAVHDEFIMDEPIEDRKTPAPVSAPLPIVEPETVPLTAESPEIAVPEAMQPDSATSETGPEPVFETAPLPETLLSNEEAVNLERLESQGEAVLESSKQKGNFAVQAGAFRKESNALRFYDRLRDKGYNVFNAEAEIRGKKWFRVRIGYFPTLDQAKSVLKRLKEHKIRGFVVNIKK